ncbi:MAG: ABC transporter permease [Acidimicrobiales bacterium]
MNSVTNKGSTRIKGSFARRVLAQARAELTLTLRRGESVLVSLGLPVLLLVFFSLIDVVPTGATGRAVDFLAPGVLALAVMSTAMVGVGIATAFERQYGVLKRLGSTPLGRPALLAGKTLAVVAVELIQIVVLTATAALLGWRPSGSVLVVAAALALGTVAFSGLGLLMAGSLKAEVVLAVANGLYVVLLLLGGMVVPLDVLPEPISAVARLLPAAALSDLVHAGSAGDPAPAAAWLVLAGWAVLGPLAASRTFRWE